MTVSLALLILGLARYAGAAPGNISATLHNLSRSGPGSIKAPSSDGETQVCVFCHTPHGASSSLKAPLWNRSVNTAQTYTRYTSSSLDANAITDGFSEQPGGSSVLCLSCHDGMLALGNVNVLLGKPATIALDNTVDGKMNPGASTNTAAGSSRGALTGYTRVLGDDLSNDHPISITFNDELARRDGELQRMTTATPEQPNAPTQRDTTTDGKTIAIRGAGTKPLLPLEPTGKNGLGQVQCATCHDPHLDKQKFLRLNRYQVAHPGSSDFSESGDQICLACHRKLGLSWAQSAHADPTTANYVYKDEAANLRGFTPGKKVWEIACLNCHDTHTVSGSRRLLREGTGTSANAAPGSFQAGSATRPLAKVSSIENTCYQCHNTTDVSILQRPATIAAANLPGIDATTGVPNIYTEFQRLYKMPIKQADQKGTDNANDSEVHDIVNADFMESQTTLGANNHTNRHVECTDCHNPHRVIKNSLFNGTGSATRRTHVPGDANGNLASGVLRGIWGVQPTWSATPGTWPENPTYEVKQGDPGTSVLTDRGQAYLTREYQLCFKCHSDYGAGATMPLMTNTTGGTPSNTNSIGTRWTNVAAEFNVAAKDDLTGADQGEVSESSVASIDDGVNIEPTAVNHRSWHPVTYPTGRTRDERRIAATGSGVNFRAPFDSKIGTQTMHCSDCHGHSASWTQGTGPNLNYVQGPHGSDKPFLLKGDWSYTQSSIGSPGFCGNCHNPTTVSCDRDNCYGDGLTNQPSGFNNHGTNAGGGHGNAHSGKPCMRCHIAVPHGWRNKAFLANLNCVGKEAGKATDCENHAGRFVSLAPYYVNAFLRIVTWRASGNWTESSCGASSSNSGKDWMDDSGTGCR